MAKIRHLKKKKLVTSQISAKVENYPGAEPEIPQLNVNIILFHPLMLQIATIVCLGVRWSRRGAFCARIYLAHASFLNHPSSPLGGLAGHWGPSNFFSTLAKVWEMTSLFQRNYHFPNWHLHTVERWELFHNELWS